MFETRLATTLESIQPIANKAAKFFAIIAVASTDFNTLVQNISMIAAIVCFCFSGNVRAQLKQSFRHPVFQAFLIMFAFFCLTAIIHPNPAKYALNGIHKYGKFLYALFLVPIFSDASLRRWSIDFFIAAISVIVLLMYLKFAGLVHIGSANIYGEVFRNHIENGFILSLAIFFLLHRCYDTKNPLAMALLLLMLAAQFGINDGRIGYITTLAAFALFIWQRLSLKQSLSMLALSAVVLFACFSMTHTFQYQIKRTLSSTQAFHQQQDVTTSVGIRLDYWQNVPTMLRAHPLTGFGLGSFRYHYPKLFPNRPSSHFDHPHNSFLLVAAETGLIGLALLCFFLATLWRASAFLETPANFYCQGLVLAYVIGGMVEPVYFRSPTGYTLVFLLSLCLGATRLPVPSLKNLWIKQKKLESDGHTTHPEFQ